MLDQYPDIRDDQLWLIHMVDECIFNLADIPQNVISRIGGNIEVSDDIANDLDSFFLAIKSNNSKVTDTAYFKAVSIILEKLDDITSWSNDAFVNDAKWQEIRRAAKCAYLQRFGLTSRCTGADHG
jgi:hypothetical protein